MRVLSRTSVAAAAGTGGADRMIDRASPEHENVETINRSLPSWSSALLE